MTGIPDQYVHFVRPVLYRRKVRIVAWRVRDVPDAYINLEANGATLLTMTVEAAHELGKTLLAVSGTCLSDAEITTRQIRTVEIDAA